MKKIGLLIIVFLLLYAFRGTLGFEEQVIKNFNDFVQGRPHEKVYLHTDKSAYVAGENVWFRAYGVHALVNTPEILSRFIYVDLVDKRDSLVDRVKVGLRDSCFYGQFPLAKSLPQGEYCLRAYTYNLQKLGREHLFKKKIRVINPQDSRVRTDISYRKDKDGYIASIKFTDGNGEPYVRIPVMCSVGEHKVGDYGKKIFMDEKGMLEVKVDSANEVMKLAFAGGKPFHFERYIRVPELLDDFDVQFFPEGGALLVGNRQQVAFKAIGSDGHPIEVSGTIYQDSIPLFEIASEHEGMGSFFLPVNRGVCFRALVKTTHGTEKWFDLPQTQVDGWGIGVTREGNMVDYLVMQGEESSLSGQLYVLVHSQGIVFDINPVKGRCKGRIDVNWLPEGISQVVLMDGKGHVYSQRLFFVKKDNERPKLAVKANEQNYVARELVELEIGFDKTDIAGTFSLSVTDDQKVQVDSLEDNIRSNLLLTSNLQGYIERPGYYFNQSTEKVNYHLDLVMQTHGWTRFDPGKIARGEFPKQKYEIEIAQMISGQVKSFWGKKAQGANIALISNYGHCYMVETDENGNFVIDNLLFNDSTRFLVQALSAKGNRRVEVMVRQDEFISPLYDLPNRMNEKEEEDKFVEKFGLDYYYEDGVKVYVLDEVTVAQRKAKKSYSFYDNVVDYQLDSAKLAEVLGQKDIYQVLLEIPGISFAKDSIGEDILLRNGHPLHILVNDLEEDMFVVRSIPANMLLSISILDPERGRVFFGEKGMGGALLVATKPGFVSRTKGERLNIKPFKLLGYQEPAEFYVPRYDVDSVRLDNRYDERTTIYWNPVIEVEPGKEKKVSFYTADVYGKYSVILEGITRDGMVYRERRAVVLK